MKIVNVVMKLKTAFSSGFKVCLHVFEIPAFKIIGEQADKGIAAFHGIKILEAVIVVKVIELGLNQ